MIIWGLEGYSVQNHRFANKGPKRAPEPILDQFFSKVKKRSKKDPGTNSGPFFNILSKVEKKGQKKIQKRFGEAQSVRLLRDA